MRIGADQRVRIGDGFAVFFLGPYGLGQVFQVHLVADTGSRRHGAEVVEGRLAPAQELVAFAVALVFQLDVLPERILGAEIVDHDRVVDDEVDRNQRIDLLRVAAELHGGIAHGGKIDHGRDAGEVLHQHTGRTVGDLMGRLAGRQPRGDGADVVRGHRAAVFEAQQVFQNDLQRKRQLGNAVQAVLLRVGNGKVGVGLVTDGQCFLGFKAIEGLWHDWRSPSGSVAASRIRAAAGHENLWMVRQDNGREPVGFP